MSTLEAIFETIGHSGIKLAVLLVVAVVIGAFVRRLLLRLASSRHMTPGTTGRLLTSLRFSAFAVVILVSMQITGLFAEAWALLSATIAALAVAFVATWSILSNVTCALILLTFRPFRIDDEIEVLEGDKTLARGKVADLNLIFTTIVDENGACRLPNNLLLQKVVRVTRRGVAPDPTDDMSAPFF